MEELDVNIKMFISTEAAIECGKREEKQRNASTRQAGKQASRQASKASSRQESKQEGRQAGRQAGRMLDDCLAENAGTQPSDVPLARRRDALARLTLPEGYIRAHNFIVAMHFKDFMTALPSATSYTQPRV
ncbi:hypothetical protein M0804_001119 [Polistes exclamans]|nr:hypothetical protein M0804_001119 [Polistes exclamans]